MRINLKKLLTIVKFKTKYLYLYLLFKFKPIVYYNNTYLRNCGKTWLTVKTASAYNLFILTSSQQHAHYISEQAKVMVTRGLIKKAPTVYTFNEHLRGFGNIKVILDDFYTKDYDILKHEFPNVEIIGGFVFDPNYKKEEKIS